MRKSIFQYAALILGMLAAPLAARSAPQTLTSPDGKLLITADLGASGGFTYAFEANGKKLIAPSALGLDFGPAGKMPDSGWRVLKTRTRTVDSTWKPVWGKRASVPDRYHETTWELTGSGASFDRMTITVRAYDDGIAVRYGIPADTRGQAARAVADLTEYNFAGDFTAWFYNGENANLGPDKLSALSGVRKPVMTVRAADDSFLAVHEADLRSGEPLGLAKCGSTGFRALAAPGVIAPGYEGPWRVIFFGATPGAMVDSHLIELLNPDPVGDFSWVKPGVAVWDWRIRGAVGDGFSYGMSMPSWLRMVDFAAANGIKHLVLDANWYGPEFAHDSDPLKGNKVNDVKKLIAYGKTKNVGVWVYLNDVGGRKFPLEQSLAQYGEWGAAGVKYGFMNGTPEEKNVRTRLITELCARHKLLCDFHDGPVHPYGQVRTWPNAVTREYCHSQLDGHRVFMPKTFVTTVFVNMLAGPLDMCNGLADLTQAGREDQPSPVPSTLTAEAARTLIVFSGATVIPDIPENYRKHPELLQFISAEQMPWRESKTLSGVIGEHIVMARQAADGTWLVGAATNEEPRELGIPLGFLSDGNYEALVIQDGDDSDYRTHRESYKAAKQLVTRATTLHVKLAPGGGACVLLKQARVTSNHRDAPEGAVRVESLACTDGKEENNQRLSRWSLGTGIATIWKLDGSKLPHNDFIEQGGRRVGQIVRYSIDGAGLLNVTRTVVWPSLRIFPNDTHGSFIQTYGSDANPVITVDGQPMGPLKVTEVRLDGALTFIGSAGELSVKRATFPSFDKYTALDRWTLTNSGSRPVSIAVAPLALKFEKDGPYGKNIAEVFTDAPASALLEPGKSLTFSILFSARLAASAPVAVDAAAEEARRHAFIEELNGKLQLETPDPVLNRAFAFAKWRVAEAINDTRGGLMLAPGNGKYYAATWCNDNVEYAGPFFPFLGDEAGIAGSLNAYRQYIGFMKPDYHRIPCSVVAEGTGTWGPFDRGDAAMYAYGASRFCLALGDKRVADELWKGIEWTLEYCKRKLLPEGVVASDKDELEGRLPTGKANLTTSSLYYGGLRSAADLGRSLGKTALATDYNLRADRLAKAIDSYFGATVEGFASYRYYDGNTNLRSWICMPLSMGIIDRKHGTVEALFSPRMWTPDGLASQSGDKVFWDRSTLYAFRSVFQAGETVKALNFLGQYTRRRLLGEHVPYAVEAYPEGGQGHLASESGLYCRIFTEGMFGILPTGLDCFKCTPRLPEGWPSMALRRVKAFGGDFDLLVSRSGEKLRVQIIQGNITIKNTTVNPGETVEVTIPKSALGQIPAQPKEPAALSTPDVQTPLPSWDFGASLFSTQGSWLLLRPSSGQLNLFDSYIANFAKAQVGAITFTQGGASPVNLDYSATPVVLNGNVRGGADGVRVLLYGERDVLIETTDLGAHVSLGTRFPLLSADPGNRRSWQGLGPEGKVDIVVLQGAAALNKQALEIEPAKGKCRLVLRVDPVAGKLPEDWRQAERQITNRWVDFRREMPSVSVAHVSAMEQAWLNLWSSYVPPAPPYFHGNVVLMSKFKMNALWPWDHCFNALALGIIDRDKGFEQLIAPFWNQLADGALPDKTTPKEMETRCTKPPIHGWALGKLMDMHRLSKQQLEFIYPKLALWTEFWFAKRDSNHNGIPGFAGIIRGWECGWDNSSAVDNDSAEYEAPELQAYLILQMRTLARVADQLGRKQEADQWRKRAADHLDLFHRAFWKDGRFCLRGNNGNELDPNFTSLEPLMCLVLGELLKPEVFAALVAQLDPYKTEYGLASEMPSSPRYNSDGYWLGPVWAPAMYLVADGLKRGGRADLAADLAEKYDRAITKAGGYYENFDAKTGRGLKAPSYTWSGSVHVLFLHEYME